MSLPHPTLETLTEENTRLNIVQDILGHPLMQVSFYEFQYYNPSQTEQSIESAVTTLTDAGLLIEHEFPNDVDTPMTPYPTLFYSLSDTCWNLLEDNEILIDQLDDIRRDMQLATRSDTVAMIESGPHIVTSMDTYTHPLDVSADVGTVVSGSDDDVTPLYSLQSQPS